MAQQPVVCTNPGCGQLMAGKLRNSLPHWLTFSLALLLVKRTGGAKKVERSTCSQETERLGQGVSSIPVLIYNVVTAQGAEALYTS